MKAAVCDRYLDCPGGDDEKDCHYKVVNVSRIISCKQTVKTFSFSQPLKKVTWNAAKKYCESKGRKMATLKNQNEQDQIERLMITNGLANENVWLGLSDIKEEGFFKWEDETDLKYTKFENWKPGEPNDFHYWRKNPLNLEHCVQANGKDNFWPGSNKFQWNDMPCDQSNNIPKDHLSYILCENIECAK
ncbi:macrophage mannose receptor 1-like [Macrosteles quadrilineatus]|uniref:macrophage mannose receptor 1-like n=1 Tax=Macrosteles quadrilineatus TaxID=74068 RepID=UPI0023E2A38C|nr:macrophage mannose receptor 1-like [Macrosteles quadrilineatus]